VSFREVFPWPRLHELVARAGAALLPLLIGTALCLFTLALVALGTDGLLGGAP
jgi:hypothetical protein